MDDEETVPLYSPKTPSLRTTLEATCTMEGILPPAREYYQLHGHHRV